MENMKNRARRYLPLVLLGFAALVALPGLAAAQSFTPANNDPAALDLASLTKAACHGNVSCQPDYPSCATWSGYSDCDAPLCGINRFCGTDCPDPDFCFGPATKQRRERFRVCFDELGNSCTEWQLSQYLVDCGC